MQHRRFSIIKQLGAPGRMIAFRPRMEKLIVRPVKFVDSLAGIPYRVRMYQIQQNRNSHLMCCIDQALQSFRFSVPGGCREEIADLISKRAVIRMLHHRHQLNSVVSVRLDSWQNLFREVIIGRDMPFFIRHSYMRLIDQKRFSGDFIFFVRPDKQLVRMPDLPIESKCFRILNHTVNIQRNPVKTVPIPCYPYFDAGLMGKLLDLNLPIPVLIDPLHWRSLRIPMVEVANQRHRVRARRPFPIDPALL